MSKAAWVSALLIGCMSVPALAQHAGHAGHAGHDGYGGEAPHAPSEDHSAHHQPEPTSVGDHAHDAIPAVEQGGSPPVPTDHAADAIYDRAAMASARAAMTRENGGMTFSQVMLDRLEYRSHKGRDGYHWEGEAWFGGDINRFTVKTEGEGSAGGRLENAEVQALYSRAVNPWFNLEAGIRHDMRPEPQRAYAVIGIDGLAPYWFEVSAQTFLSDKGDAHFRLEASYDQRITQRLILQPAAELNISAQDVPELRLGSGLTALELGLRLRYEIAREFAPYVGVNWERKLGDTADYARAESEETSATSFLMGVRFWF